MALPGPVTGDFECTGIQLVGAMAQPGSTSQDVQVTFQAQSASVLRGTVTFTTDVDTAKNFEVGNSYDLTAADHVTTP